MQEHHGISDPGEVVAQKAIEEGIEVIPIPGACAAISALIASGLNTKEFAFIGFLSANKGEKKAKLEELKYETRTLIFYEAPHKLQATLETMLEVLGDRQVCLARELTKIHEEFIRDNLSTLIEQNVEIKGEFVIVVEGSTISKKENDIIELNKLSLEEHYERYKKEGLEKKEIIKRIAKDRNVSKNEIYQYFL